MKEQDGKREEDGLRERARKRLAAGEADLSGMTPGGIQNVVEEFRIRQAELEIQNEELRQTQRQLSDAHDRYRTLYEAAPVGYCTLREQRIVELNQATCDILRQPRDCLETARLVDFIAPESLYTYWAFDERVRQSDGSDACELALHNLRGDRWYVRLECSDAHPDHHGSERFCVLVDITDRRQAEEALRELNATLEQRVAERTGQLESQAEQLRRLASDLASAEQRERRRLASALHDEVQQLLVAAGMWTDHARSRATSGGDPTGDLDQAQRTLERTVEASRSITRELYPPVLSTRGLPTALDWMAEHFHEYYGLPVSANIASTANPGDPDVQAFLFQAARELLMNVVKHAQASGAQLDARHENGTLALVIADDGRGIDAEESLAAGDSQEGFGLFSLRERVRATGGDLQIDSSSDGSRVAITCPIETDEPENRSDAATVYPGEVAGGEAEAVTGRPVRVMLADDHRVVREGLAGIIDGAPDLECVAGGRPRPPSDRADRYGGPGRDCDGRIDAGGKRGGSHASGQGPQAKSPDHRTVHA